MTKELTGDSKIRPSKRRHDESQEKEANATSSGQKEQTQTRNNDVGVHRRSQNVECTAFRESIRETYQEGLSLSAKFREKNAYVWELAKTMGRNPLCRAVCLETTTNGIFRIADACYAVYTRNSA